MTVWRKLQRTGPACAPAPPPMSISTKVTGFTDQSGHTEYQLETTGPDGRAVSAQHRFSDFVELHTVIQPALKLPIAFPIPKSMFTGEAVKRERQQKLQEYLRTALAACDATPPLALMSFLGLRAGGPSGSGSAPDVANPPPASAESFAPFSEFQVVRKDDVNEGLRDAIKANDTQLAMSLIDAKADPNYRDRQGNTPLHMACMFNRTDVARALCQGGADTELKNLAGELCTRMASVSLKMKIKKYQDTGTFP